MNETIVTDDKYVIVLINGVEVDRPGPWSTAEGARAWAEMILFDLENGVDHYGNQEG